MLRHAFTKYNPEVVPVERLFLMPQDLYRYLWPTAKKWERQRALRFLIIAGLVETVWLARKALDPASDAVAYRLSKKCDQRARDIAIVAAHKFPTSFKFTKSSIRKALRHGIEHRPRKRAPRPAPSRP